MSEIDDQRLLGDLHVLRRFGHHETGVDRIAFSEPDLAARRWLAGHLQDAGLELEMDRCGNVFGHASGVRRAVLVGSHTDSVPKGGWLDGALGVIYALEIARALQPAGLSVDVVSFQDEEGSFLPCLGSRLFTGEFAPATLKTTPGPEGASLAATFEQLCLGEGFARLDRERNPVFFEAHIEQGPRLETADIPVGVVSGIVGIRRSRLTARGRPDHAGTTPIIMRRDDGRTAIRLAAAIPDLIANHGGPETVWNIGTVSFLPGAANVVPAEAAITVEMRDLDPAILDRLEGALQAVVATANDPDGVTVELASVGCVPPVAMDPRLATLLAEAAGRRGLAHMRLPSGAGHDAMILGRVVPSAMLFVPSIGGRSHNISEDTREEHIVGGCRVLCDAVAQAARELAA